MPLLSVVLPAACAVFIYVSLAYLLGRTLKRNDVADVAWGPGIALSAFVAYAVAPDPDLRLTILAMLASLWGVRLALRIFIKNRTKPEDPRYQKMGASWGAWAPLISYLQVFLFQGALMLMVAYPFLHAAAFPSALGILAWAGMALWAVGFYFEAVGDNELDAFLAKPENKGKIMRYGLWSWSRHPNYFGEVAMWWGIFLIVLETPYGIAALVSPLLITFLILRVSGIPMLEKMFEGNPEFEEYKRTTSAFFPLPPKWRGTL